MLSSSDKCGVRSKSYGCEEVKLIELAGNGSWGRLLHHEHDSRHFMAVSLLKMHQIFMLALAQSRAGAKKVAQVLAVSQPPP